MKQILFMLLLLSSVSLFAQTDSDSSEPYVQGIPLRSIQATYAVIVYPRLEGYIRPVENISFDYGQRYKKQKELTVTDKQGNAMTFRSFAHLLNVFSSLGWGGHEMVL